jgi:hypothetical protein
MAAQTQWQVEVSRYAHDGSAVTRVMADGLTKQDANALAKRAIKEFGYLFAEVKPGTRIG